MLVLDAKVMKVYDLFKRAMYKSGRMISFPEHTDPKKTYGWRYLSKFVSRLDDLELDDAVIPQIVNALVEQARKDRLLSRGIAILDRKDLLEVCIARLEREKRECNDVVRAVIRSHQFLLNALNEGTEKQSMFDILSARKNKQSYANVTRWHQSGQLSIHYVAVSRVCRKSLGTLDDSELKLFPPAKQLLKTRLMHLSDGILVQKLKEILKEDLFEE